MTREQKHIIWTRTAERKKRQTERRRLARIFAVITAALMVVAMLAMLVTSCNAYAEGFAPREGGERWLAVLAAVAFADGVMRLVAWLDTPRKRGDAG